MTENEKIILESRIEQLEKYKNELFGETEQLKKQKWELISIIKATAELINKFEMYNEMSFEILFQHIENILKKHGVKI